MTQKEYGRNSADWWGEGQHPGIKLFKTLGLILIGVVMFMLVYPIMWGYAMLWGWI